MAGRAPGPCVLLAVACGLAAGTVAHAAVGAQAPAGFPYAAPFESFADDAARAAAPSTPDGGAPGAGLLALATPGLERLGGTPLHARSLSSGERKGGGVMPMLSPERARILLQSLTVPGWGQVTVGRNGAAKVFFLAETAIWASFIAFQVQEQMRRDSYELTARLHAGIDLNGRDEEFRRIVGNYLSSDDYNQFVVYRDAANLHYDDPEAFRAYVAAHELKGADAWHWANENDALRYRSQRKDSQRAEQRSNTAVALAVVNRFVSAVHAMRAAGRPVEARSWNFEVTPVESDEALALRCGVRTRF